MSVVGITAEYNPFHFGHEYHINRTRAMFPDSTVVCAMSGDFVQRGEAALFSKFARAEAAVRCGADLVAEIPLPWSLSSAEGFARGAVEILSALGAEYISFGSELGKIAPLEKLADFMLKDEFLSDVKKVLSASPELSFAKARELAAKAVIGEDAALLENPNNILAVEYIKAVKNIASHIIPITVEREGNQHDQSGAAGFLSASEIRKRVLAGEDIFTLVPQNAAEIYDREICAGRFVQPDMLETAIISRLRMLKKDDFAKLPDCSDGLGDRLYNAVRESVTLSELYDHVKTKKYPLSRIKRACMCAALGVKNGMSNNAVPYIRILSANEKGCRLLRNINGKCSLPILIKPADIRKNDRKQEEMFAIGAYAHDLYVLGYRLEKERKCGQDWRNSPKIVK